MESKPTFQSKNALLKAENKSVKTLSKNPLSKFRIKLIIFHPIDLW